MNILLRYTAILTLGILIFSSSCKKDDPIPVTVINFSDLSLSTNSYWNGSDESGKFSSGNAIFENTYTVAYGSWGGFAYANQHDTITGGYTNQYSVFVSEPDSNKFAVAYISDTAYMSFTKPMSDVSINVANNTYAALLILNGDSYTKKFGGATGNDPDWFKITIKGYRNKQYKGTTEVFLADYTSSDNSKDYILKKWKNVDLSAFGEIDVVSFKLSSTDNGDWGMNTPAYFCLDNIQGKITQ